MNKLTQESVINKFIITHGSKYNYNNVDYIKATIPVKIICKEHDEFEQSPSIHYNGSGCPKCAINKNNKNLKSNVNEFIQKANIKHNNQYDYSNTKYNNSRDKIEIICNTHKSFWQTPNNHLSGNICPKCAREITSNPIINPHLRTKSSYDNMTGIFYKLKFKHKELEFEFIKIGITSKSIKERYQSYGNYTYEILEENKTTNLESAILEYNFIKNTKLAKFKFPDGIKFGGYTECYNIIDSGITT